MLVDHFIVSTKLSRSPSFRAGAKHRTRNLEIPRCAIAHLRSGPSDHPGMTECWPLRSSTILGSLILPFRRALFDECADAFFGVARHHVVGHHLCRIAVGVGKAHLGLAVECLLAELDR